MAGKSSVPVLLHLVEAVHAGGRLLADAADASARCAASCPGASCCRRRSSVEDDAPLLGLARRRRSRARCPALLELDALVDEQRRVAAVVDDQVGPAAVGHTSASSVHHQYSSSVSPFQAKTATPCGLLDACRSRPTATAAAARVLRREDVARHPAHVGAEVDERLDQHRGLHRHVQRAHDARAGERLRRARTARAAPSGRASPARRGGSPCGPSSASARSFTLKGGRSAARRRAARGLSLRARAHADLRVGVVTCLSASWWRRAAGGEERPALGLRRGRQRLDADAARTRRRASQSRHLRAARSRARRGPSARGTRRGRARSMSTTRSRPPGPQRRAPPRAARRAGSATWCSTRHETRGVERAVVDRQRLELAVAHLDVASKRAEPLARRRRAWRASRRRRSRCATNGASASVTWPVPQPRSPTTQLVVEQRRRAPRGRSGRRTARARRRSHWPAAEAKKACERRLALGEDAGRGGWSSCAATGVRAGLLAQERPEPARRRIERVAPSSR